MHTLIFGLAMLVVGFSLGRIKNLKSAEAKVAADVAVLKADEKKL